MPPTHSPKPCLFSGVLDGLEVACSKTDSYGSFTDPDYQGRWGEHYVLRFWPYDYMRGIKAELRAEAAAQEAAALKELKMWAVECAARRKEANSTLDFDVWHADALVRLKAPRKWANSIPLGDLPIHRVSPLEEISKRFLTLAMPKENAPLKRNAKVNIRFRAVGCVRALVFSFASVHREGN